MSQTLPERRTGGQADRWEPLGDLEQVSERMRRMLDQTFGGAGWRSLLADTGGWVPSVDIEEEDGAYVIEAELPGVKKDDVEIDLVGNELSITGEIKERQRKGIVRRQTRRVGRFAYRVALSDTVDAEKVEARLNDGVLTVRVPKAEQARRRRIEVKPS